MIYFKLLQESARGRKILHGVAATLLVSLLVGCDEDFHERYETHAEAENAGAVERGWIPSFIPSTATEIIEVHNIDNNLQRLSFVAPREDLRTMVASLAPSSFAESVRLLRYLPEARSVWPRELQDTRGGPRTLEDSTYYRTPHRDAARCVAVRWSDSTAFVWSC